MARTVQDLLTISTPQIVVAQHYNRRFGEIWTEHTLATGIETVAVDQGEDWGVRHGCGLCS